MVQITDGLDLYRALSELARRYQFRSKDEVCCYGLTVSQCYALQLLAQEDSLTSSQLSAKLSLDISSTTRLVDQLVKKKLAVRRSGYDDARVREILITEAGRRLIERIETDFAKMLQTALADFPAEVQEALPDVLRRLTQVLESCAPGKPALITNIRTVKK
jgi:MarR family 2-MHQ and catechol resistance regulon transcriptional repressor